MTIKHFFEVYSPKRMWRKFWISLAGLPMLPQHRAKCLMMGGVKVSGRVLIYGDVTIDTVFPDSIYIGNGTRITTGTKILTHYIDTSLPGVHFKRGEVHIEDNVFIGVNVCICNSVTIGEGAIVGAGSVVTKDIPPYQVWAGNPARYIIDPMKIAILIPTIKPGGAEKQAVLLAATLSQEYEVHFVALYGQRDLSVALKEYLEDNKVTVHFLSGKRLKKWVEYYRLLIDNSIDVAFNYLTVCDVIGAMIERLARVKTVFNGIRNSYLPPLKLFTEWLSHSIIADYTIYNCKSGAEYFERHGFSKKKTIVIPNCFPNISEPINRGEKEIKTIITVGRFEPQKDYLTAIRSIAELRKMRKDFVFTIIGHGNLETHIRNWVIEYGLSDFTQILIAPSNVQDILKAADIYLSTSLYEGTSNSIMEAMNWSLPVVATNVGDNYMLVDNNVSGYLTEVGNVSSLSQGLKSLLSSSKIRQQMGLKGHEKLSSYSPEAFKNRYYTLLKTRI